MAAFIQILEQQVGSGTHSSDEHVQVLPKTEQGREQNPPLVVVVVLLLLLLILLLVVGV